MSEKDKGHTISELGDRRFGLFGDITPDSIQRLGDKILRSYQKNPDKEIELYLTSLGGWPIIAFAFYDLITKVLKCNLRTIGSGSVSSVALLVFLTGRVRVLTPHTILYFRRGWYRSEPAFKFNGFHPGQDGVGGLARLEHLSDDYFAEIVAQSSRNGKLTADQVTAMVRDEVVITPPEALALGLVDEILD